MVRSDDPVQPDSGDPHPVRGKPLLQGALVLAALLAGAYFNIVFRGESLTSSDNSHPFDDSGVRLRPTKISDAPFLNWYDQGAVVWQWEPAAQFFRRAMRKGVVPLWDPTIAAGVDAHVNVTQGQYFPPYMLLLALGDPPLLRNLYYLGLVLFGGGCLYLLLVRNSVGTIAAVTGGAVFMFCGALTQNINSIMGQSAAMLPLMVLSVDWLLDRPTGKRIAATAVALAGAALASFLPIVISGYIIVGIFLLARIGSSVRSSREARTAGLEMTLVGVATILLSLLLLAFLFVPLELNARADPSFAKWYKDLGFQSYPFELVYTLISPSISYDVLQHTDPSQVTFPKPYPWTSHFFYVGLIPILVLPLVRARTPRQRVLLVFASASGALLFLKLLGVPPFQWLAYLPVFNTLHFIPYFCGALTLCVATLTALAVDALTDRPVSRRVIASTIVWAVAVFCGVAHFAVNHGIAQSPQPLAFLAEVVFLATLAGALVLVSWLQSRGRLRGAPPALVVSALVLVQLIPIAYHRRYERSAVWRNVPDYVRFLQSDQSLFRIHGVHSLALTANVFQGLELSGISSRHTFNPSRYSTLARRYFNSGPTLYPLPTALLPSQRSILDMLGVKYLITVSPASSEEATLETGRGFLPVRADGRFTIWRNERAWPRTYLAHRFIVVRDGDQALSRVGTLDRPDRVVLEEAPSFQSASAATPQGHARVVSYQHNHVDIVATASRPGILVLTDSFAPGWTVTVNGKPARLLQANFAFRGVEVPAGRSVVLFSYFPPGLRIGLILSGLAAGILLLLAFWRADPGQS